MSNWIGKHNSHIDACVSVKTSIWRLGWGIKAPNIVVLEDDNGNIITIRTAAQFTVGQKWKISGIVKRHLIFRGQRQTHLRNWELSL